MPNTNNNAAGNLEDQKREYMNKLEELRRSNDVNAICDEFYQSFYEYTRNVMDDKVDPVAGMKTDALKAFMDELTEYEKPAPVGASADAEVNGRGLDDVQADGAVNGQNPAGAQQDNGQEDDENHEIKPENQQFLLEFLQEINRRFRETTVEYGGKIDEWDRKIRNGEVPHTELIKDEPKKTKKLAHAIVMETGIEGNSVTELQRVVFEKINARKIKNATVRSLYVSIDKANFDLMKGKYALSEKKLKDYENLFSDRNPNKSLGYVINTNGTEEGQELFSQIPEYIRVFSNLTTKEQIEAREKELNDKLFVYERQVSQVKSAVKVAEYLGGVLDELNEGHDETLGNEYSRKYLKKFTHLGKDYKLENSSDSDTIGYVNVRDATEYLDSPAKDFVEDMQQTLNSPEFADGGLNTAEGKRVKKLAETADNIHLFNQLTMDRNKEFEKLGINTTTVEKIKNELFYLRKYKKSKGYISGEPAEDDFTAKIDEYAEALSDSVINDGLDNKCYDDVYISLKQYKSIYQNMRIAEKQGNMDEFDRFNKALKQKGRQTRELINACKEYEKGDIIKRNINKEVKSRSKVFDSITASVSKTFERPEKNFESYIYFHVGKYSGESQPEKRANMVKVLAAYSLKKMGRKFDLKEIHKAAEHIKELYILDDDNAYIRGDKRLAKALASKESVLAEGEKIRRDIYDIKNDKYDDYVRDMKTLKESLRSDKNRSKEYKALYKAIDDASKLDETTKNMTAEEKAAVFRQTNIDMISTIQKYVKGKETVRIQEKGNDAFANSMDALSIISKYTKTGTNPMSMRVINVISGINKIRKDEELNFFVTFEQRYGAARAKASAEARRARQNGNNDAQNANSNPKRVSKAPGAGK